MTFVTIPTASYVGRDPDNSNNSLLPEMLPANADFNQQHKLWRFYCTCLDLGCSAYKLEDFHGKNMSSKDKYLYWVKDWKMHYQDVSDLIRKYKWARSQKWFDSPEQKDYREKLKKSYVTKYKHDPTNLYNNFWYGYHCSVVNENIEKLKMSAQHLLNARFTAKLASHALVIRNRSKT